MNVQFNPIFNDLPFIVLPSYQFPAYDGDMAELHHLAETVFGAVKAGGRVSMRPSIYKQTVDATWIDATQMLAWNWDRAGDLLREWING